MPDSHPPSSPPGLQEQGDQAVLNGCWTFAGLQDQRAALKARLRGSRCQRWDLRAIEQMDSSGALLLWQGWQQQRPPDLQCTPEQQALLDALLRIDHLETPAPPPAFLSPVPLLNALGDQVQGLLHNLSGIVMVFGRVMLASVWLLRHPHDFPGRELSASIFRAGVQALGITALVGFLIGIVLSYLSAQQLAQYGANLLIVDLLGISIVRELAPLLAAILVAGRSGSSITAQIGIMRINQELDAMSVLGLSQTLRLAWPKVIALMIVMPLLALWTDILALTGGMLAAQMELGLTLTRFMERLPEVVPLRHVWVGLGKSVAFGALIGLIACFFGFNVQSSSESLGRATTSSVVTGITLVILADALFAVMLSFGGTP